MNSFHTFLMAFRLAMDVFEEHLLQHIQRHLRGECERCVNAPVWRDFQMLPLFCRHRTTECLLERLFSNAIKDAEQTFPYRQTRMLINGNVKMLADWEGIPTTGLLWSETKLRQHLDSRWAKEAVKRRIFRRMEH